MGETKANAQVAGFLFNSARGGNVSAQIFWLKTRARWRETPVELKHSGSIGQRDLSELSDQDLLNIIGSVATELKSDPATILVEDATPAMIEDNPTLVRFPVPVR
jgi:hypothetical protein